MESQQMSRFFGDSSTKILPNSTEMNADRKGDAKRDRGVGRRTGLPTLLEMLCPLFPLFRKLPLAIEEFDLQAFKTVNGTCH